MIVEMRMGRQLAVIDDNIVSKRVAKTVKK
jgi:hypothetical protein